MAAVFIIFGVVKIINNARMRAYMIAHGVPDSLILLAILVEVVGGILVLIGYKTRLAALMMAGFCIVATSLFHTQFSAGGELAHFTKDLAIAGGFLFMIAYGPGPLSVDARLGRTKEVREGRNFKAQENKV
jgi:putative oxidoreductase